MKIIVSPFLWFLFIQGAGLLLLLRWGSIKRSRTLIRLLLVLIFLLTIISTPLSSNWLKNTLVIRPTEKITTPPVAIFVLAGGYLPGATRDEDVLWTESQRRVLHSGEIWRCYPDAILVFSGAEAYEGRGGSDRITQLMEDVALCSGVSRSSILLEPRSINTREHPIEALKLPGMTPTTTIGVVRPTGICVVPHRSPADIFNKYTPIRCRHFGVRRGCKRSCLQPTHLMPIRRFFASGWVSCGTKSGFSLS
jgi:hypothetical protein